MKRILAGATTAAVVSALVVAGGAGAAFADTGDGAITVTVVNDRNLNSVIDDTTIDTRLAGVSVSVTDAEGNVATDDTDADGLVTFDAAALAALVGGQYRVEVSTPSWTSPT